MLYEQEQGCILQKKHQCCKVAFSPAPPLAGPLEVCIRQVALLATKQISLNIKLELTFGVHIHDFGKSQKYLGVYSNFQRQRLVVKG